MRLNLNQEETAPIAREQAAMLDEVREQLLAGGELSRLEQNGVRAALDPERFGGRPAAQVPLPGGTMDKGERLYGI